MAVEGRRWAIEDAFETAKNELGLDHNETRSWHDWHRQVSLVMLAFAVLAVAWHRADKAAKQTPPCMSRAARRLSVGPSRKSNASQVFSGSVTSGPRSSSHGQLCAACIKQVLNALT